jgi:hypothetical protein
MHEGPRKWLTGVMMFSLCCGYLSVARAQGPGYATTCREQALSIQTSEEASLAADRDEVEGLARTWAEKLDALKQNTATLDLRAKSRYGDADAFHKSAMLPSNVTARLISQAEGAISAKKHELDQLRQDEQNAGFDPVRLYCDQFDAYVASESLINLKADIERWTILYRSIESYLDYRLLIASTISSKAYTDELTRGSNALATAYADAVRITAKDSESIELLLKCCVLR